MITCIKKTTSYIIISVYCVLLLVREIRGIIRRSTKLNSLFKKIIYLKSNIRDDNRVIFRQMTLLI